MRHKQTEGTRATGGEGRAGGEGTKQVDAGKSIRDQGTRLPYGWPGRCGLGPRGTGEPWRSLSGGVTVTQERQHLSKMALGLSEREEAGRLCWQRRHPSRREPSPGLSPEGGHKCFRLNQYFPSVDLLSPVGAGMWTRHYTKPESHLR